MIRQSKGWEALHLVLVVQLRHVCDNEIKPAVTSSWHADKLFQFELLQKAAYVKTIKIARQ